MDKSKRLIAGVIGVLSIVATTAMATPAYAATGADYVSRGTTKVYSGAQTQSQSATKQASTKATVQSAQQQLIYGFNTINNDPNNIVYANAQGVKQVGWIKSLNGNWYYGDSTGKLVRNKWVQDGSQWYYLGADCHMVTNLIVDGYYVNRSGAWSAMKTTDEYGRQIPTYSKIGVGTSDVSLKDFEAGVANGTIKVKLLEGHMIGATNNGDGGALWFYYA